MAFNDLIKKLLTEMEPEDQHISTKTIIRKYMNTSNEHFVWKFNNSADVKLFQNAKRGDIITSDHFQVNGCTFFLELTPNGWGQFDGAVVWCALAKLPKDVYSIKVYFKYVCDEINYCGEKTKQLTTKQIAVDLGTGVHSMSANETMKTEDFKKFNSFSFKCYVTVSKFFDQNGSQIPIRQNIAEESKMDEASKLKAKIVELHEENNQLNERLTVYVQQTSLLEEQNKQIRSEKQQLQTIVDDILSNQSKLQTENNKLKTQNNILMDECKELHLQLNETKKKYKQLAKQIGPDVNNYKKWDHDNIADWILCLHDDYVKYEQVLRKKLKEESMTGDFLHELDKTDLDRFGIKSFRDKSVIMEHIQTLTSKQGQQKEGAKTADIL
eukprot:438424_1